MANGIRLFSQHLRTTYHTTLSEIPDPQILPVLATARNMFPDVTPAAEIHSSNACFVHCGIGTVRMWPPLPMRSTMAQCPCLVWMSSRSSPASSDRRSPQPKSMANIAQSRFARRFSPRARISTAELCSCVSQLPERWPNCFTPSRERYLRRGPGLTGRRQPPHEPAVERPPGAG
jgi:hypothetical protein